MKWKVGATYVGIMLTTFIGLFLLLTSASSPDDLLPGTWQEVSWEYEKVDKNQDSDSLSGKEISNNVKQLISQDLIVHRAEQWEFLPGGALSLTGKNTPAVPIHWKLKGRGHILVLHYDDRTEESYTMVQLDENKMVLHFYTEIQARGIAKITFTRAR